MFLNDYICWHYWPYNSIQWQIETIKSRINLTNNCFFHVTKIFSDYGYLPLLRMSNIKRKTCTQNIFVQFNQFLSPQIQLLPDFVTNRVPGLLATEHWTATWSFIYLYTLLRMVMIIHYDYSSTVFSQNK